MEEDSVRRRGEEEYDCMMEERSKESKVNGGGIIKQEAKR